MKVAVKTRPEETSKSWGMQREGLGQVALHPEDNFVGYECQKVFLGGTLKVTAVAWALVTVTAFEGGLHDY